MKTELQLVSKKDLKATFGIPYSLQHVARLEKAGQFPQRIQLGPNRVAWLRSEIEDWINVRLAGRSAATPSR